VKSGIFRTIFRENDFLQNEFRGKVPFTLLLEVKIRGIVKGSFLDATKKSITGRSHFYLTTDLELEAGGGSDLKLGEGDEELDSTAAGGSTRGSAGS
jgi:hypothetical protein